MCAGIIRHGRPYMISTRRSNGLLEKLGFDREGVQKEMAYLNGIYYDKRLYGMTSDQFNAMFRSDYLIPE